MKRCVTLISALVAVVAARGASLADAAAPARPNVIIILADDLGYGDLGCYGRPRYKTPHLDRMASEGARLTQFNCPAPFCAPTRASLLTGRYPLRCGLPSNPAPDGNPTARKLALPAGEVTLASHLLQGGYATGMIGKWHLGHEREEYYPVRRGFDEYLGILYSNDMRPVQLIKDTQVVEYPLVQATLTRRYTAAALEFIERHRAEPFFLYLAHAMPHKPLATSEQFYKQSGAGLFGDVMTELDASVGEVIAKVRELALDERTLIVFTSDNGPSYSGSAGGLRGMKGTSWEGGYRVPLIARWPGTIPAGHTSAQLAVTMDLFATALAVAGIAPPSDRVIDGADILPLLTSNAPSPHRVVFGQQGATLASVRDARWKLHVLAPDDSHLDPAAPRRVDHRAPDGVTILAPFEQHPLGEFHGLRTGDPARAGALFDLQHDPAEQHDVAAQHPDIVRRLQSAFDEFAAEVVR